MTAASRGESVAEEESWDDERIARAIWCRLAEPGDVAARELVAAEGAVAALAQVRAGQAEGRWQVRLPEVDARRDLRTLRRFDGAAVDPG